MKYYVNIVDFQWQQYTYDVNLEYESLDSYDTVLDIDIFGDNQEIVDTLYDDENFIDALLEEARMQEEKDWERANMYDGFREDPN